MKTISNLVERKTNHCYSGNVCYLLERKGALLSEPMSFGLSAGMDFKIEINAGISFQAWELQCLKDFIERLGVKVTENKEAGIDEIIGQIKKNIDQDLPLLIEYDGYYFPFTEIYKKEHAVRRALVVGYGEDEISISDWMYSAYSFPLNKKVFRNAIDPELGSCVQPTWYDVTFPTDINQKITPGLIKEAIMSVSEYFLADHESCNCKMVGIEGIRVFAAEIENIISQQRNNTLKVDWLLFSEDLKKMAINLNHYSNFIQEILDKRLNPLYLENAQKIIRLFYEASETWLILCNLIYKFGLTQKETIINKLRQNLLKTADLLENALTICRMDLLKQ